jgi:hypothetical protein
MIKLLSIVLLVLLSIGTTGCYTLSEAEIIEGREQAERLNEPYNQPVVIYRKTF